MAKHAKPNDETAAVVGSANDILCPVVLYEIHKIADPATNWVLKITSRHFWTPVQASTTPVAGAAPPVADDLHYASANPPNAFVAEAFRSGNIHALQWAWRRRLRTNPWACALQGCSDLPPMHCHKGQAATSQALQVCMGGMYTRLSPYDANQALRPGSPGSPDGRTDAAFQWYLDTIFFPATTAAVQDRHTPLRDYLRGAGIMLLEEASGAGRLPFVLQLISAGVPQCAYDLGGALLRSAEAGHAHVAHFLLRTVKLPLDEALSSQLEEAAEVAASHGHVDVLKAIFCSTGELLPLDPDGMHLPPPFPA